MNICRKTVLTAASRGRVLLNSRAMSGSVGPMLSRQKELLPYPVPPLKETVDRYIKSVEPFLTPHELQNTKKLAEDMLRADGAGQKLYQLLVERSKTRDNWLSEWWLQGAYLGYRNPVVVYSSPAMAMPRKSFTGNTTQLSHTAGLICGLLEFKDMIDSHSIPVETQGPNKQPLDMEQYTKILGTCRIPEVPLDRLVYAGAAAKHIVVAYRNNFYRVNVYDASGKALSKGQIHAQLKHIVDSNPAVAPPVGVLTTEHRDIWSSAYKRLYQDDNNKRSLKDIQGSIAVVCIDSPLKSNCEPWQSEGCYHLLVGGKNGENGGNRWCDKTIQLIVGAEGNCGLLYEHSPAEGPPVASLLDFCVNYAEKCDSDVSVANSLVHTPELLRFDVSADVERDIAQAQSDLSALTQDMALELYTYPAYGKNFIKSMKLSPDSFVQMAMQLAFFRIHGVAGATYETAALRKFCGGRTETIRSVSTDSVAFCRAFTASNTSPNERSESLRKAVNAHKDYTNLAVNGQGVDRLFFGMKMMAAEKQLPLPPLCSDVSFIRSTHFRLSTSQVSAKTNSTMFYGPLVPDGYGSCYNPRDETINFGISCFNSCEETSVPKYRDALNVSLTEMHDALVASNMKPKL